MSMSLTFKGVTSTLRKMNSGNKKFLLLVKHNWNISSKRILEDIKRTQYSGRAGLIPRSGRLKKLLQVKTWIYGNNVTTRFSFDKDNPASIYFPTHDKSRRRRVIRAKSGGYLTFKLPDGTWRKVKRVFIPQRTDVFGAIKKGGKIFRRDGVITALRTYR